jgi:hypothetical protein
MDREKILQIIKNAVLNYYYKEVKAAREDPFYPIHDMSTIVYKKERY